MVPICGMREGGWNRRLPPRYQESLASSFRVALQGGFHHPASGTVWRHRQYNTTECSILEPVAAGSVRLRRRLAAPKDAHSVEDSAYSLQTRDATAHHLAKRPACLRSIRGPWVWNDRSPQTWQDSTQDGEGDYDLETRSEQLRHLLKATLGWPPPTALLLTARDSSTHNP